MCVHVMNVYLYACVCMCFRIKILSHHFFSFFAGVLAPLYVGMRSNIMSRTAMKFAPSAWLSVVGAKAGTCVCVCVCVCMCVCVRE